MLGNYSMFITEIVNKLLYKKYYYARKMQEKSPLLGFPKKGQLKRQSVTGCLFREGISFLWGIAKNYIMYWGVTSSIIA